MQVESPGRPASAEVPLPIETLPIETLPIETLPIETLSIESVPIAEALQLSGYDWLMVAFSLLVLLVFVSSIAKWISLLVRGVGLFGERAIISVRPRARPFWNPLYFIFFFAVLLVANLQLNQWTNQAKPATDAVTSSPTAAGLTVTQLLMSSAAMVVATLATMWLARSFRPQLVPGSVKGHQRPAVGWLPRRGDISLGFAAAFLILPPTMLMMAAVSAMQEYSHPVLDALKPNGPDSRPDLGVFAALFFTTAIVTPLVEEFWFRGMLQGGLQRLGDTITDAKRWSTIAKASDTVPPAETVNTQPDRNPQVKSPSSSNPYASPEPIDEPAWEATEPRHRDSATRSDWTPTAIWPIVVTSVMFALMHWGQGLAPVPLFFLSLGLGYLYRQTGSLVPSIIVHFVLNGFTMTATLLELLKG